MWREGTLNLAEVVEEECTQLEGAQFTEVLEAAVDRTPLETREQRVGMWEPTPLAGVAAAGLREFQLDLTERLEQTATAQNVAPAVGAEAVDLSLRGMAGRVETTAAAVGEVAWAAPQAEVGALVALARFTCTRGNLTKKYYGRSK